MKHTARPITRAAMIAALYAVLTLLLQPLGFSAVQLRVSEALTILPVLMPEAVPGLAVGCFLANLISGAPWFDVVFGTLATLLGAALTRRLRQRPVAASLMPVAANALITGTVVYFGYVWMPGSQVLPGGIAAAMATVGAGELLACTGLGLLLLHALSRIAKNLK